MMTRAVDGKQGLIPVLLKDAEMLPLLASRIWIDFRNADGPDYLARVRELERLRRRWQHGLAIVDGIGQRGLERIRRERRIQRGATPQS